ncbi:hypothetical protein HPB49_023762 [Dermacentor silvarum]|uniref:Uncharacterized protein n=1 Tax=Dermacentor silvarum TaxID=543639 RepID=A0ACB8CI53_DERSI|nr:hypothetical protein HPB49_023762 [Dermacentor silvarum]
MPRIARGAMHTIVPAVHRLYKMPSEFIFHCSIRQTGPPATLYMRLNQPPRRTLPGSLRNLPGQRPFPYPNTTHGTEPRKGPLTCSHYSVIHSELHSEISPENGRCLTAYKKPDLTDSTPVPDQHLLNVWAARQEAQDIYLTRGKTMPDRVRLNRATADSTEYANRLARENWQRHCESFDSHTGAGRVWRTFRGLSQRTRLRTAAEDLALSLRITAQEGADIAGTAFFHNEPPPSYDPSIITSNPSPPAMDDGMNSPFTKAELRAALLSTNTSSAPGPDGITYAILRNLPDNTLEELLALFNQEAPS